MSTAIDTLISLQSSLTATLGKNALNALFPKDFELYLIALELTDSKGNTIDYLSFPVMPDSIKEGKSELTTVKKTAGGITVTTTPSFVPRDIQIRGTFGKGFKVLTSKKTKESVLGYVYSTSAGIYDKITQNKGTKTIPKAFSTYIKTGYGVTKILEAIINKSTGLDADGKPMKLLFYNLILGNNYQVTVQSSDFTMDKSTNMYWQYSLNLHAIAPMEDLTKTQKTAILGSQMVTKSLSKLRSSFNITTDQIGKILF